MIEDKVEILIITYNRATFLARTLQQFVGSPFSRCRITVLDNCSTDDTPAVSAEYATRFPSFRAVRHRLNIGLSANYLRAVELSSATYTWILCDDDFFDFSDCADVIAALEDGNADLVSVGSPGQDQWERGVWTTAREAARPGANYLGVFTFASGVIFRTALFDSDAMVKGYRAAATAYPHFPFVARTIHDNRVVYVSRARIAKWDPRPNFSSDLHFWNLYVNACRTIEDRKLRRQVIDEMFPSRAQWLRALGRAISREKMRPTPGGTRQLTEIAAGFGVKQRLFLAALSPLAILPGSVQRAVQRLRRGKDHDSVRGASEVADSFRLS